MILRTHDAFASKKVKNNVKSAPKSPKLKSNKTFLATLKKAEPNIFYRNFIGY